MPQGKKENLLDYIKRIGSKAYAQEATEAKVKGNLRRELRKSGQYYFDLKPSGFSKGGFALKYYKDIL